MCLYSNKAILSIFIAAIVISVWFLRLNVGSCSSKSLASPPLFSLYTNRIQLIRLKQYYDKRLKSSRKCNRLPLHPFTLHDDCAGAFEHMENMIERLQLTTSNPISDTHKNVNILREIERQCATINTVNTNQVCWVDSICDVRF